MRSGGAFKLNGKWNLSITCPGLSPKLFHLSKWFGRFIERRNDSFAMPYSQTLWVPVSRSLTALITDRPTYSWREHRILPETISRIVTKLNRTCQDLFTSAYSRLFYFFRASHIFGFRLVWKMANTSTSFRFSSVVKWTMNGNFFMTMQRTSA